jgi:hypothetical protein
MAKARAQRPRTASLFAFGVFGVFGPVSCQPNQPETIAYVEPPAIYCYQTLAQPDCYAQPTPGDYNRMIGFYGPPPADMPAQQRAGVTITKTGPGI